MKIQFIKLKMVRIASDIAEANESWFDQPKYIKGITFYNN